VALSKGAPPFIFAEGSYEVEGEFGANRKNVTGCKKT
jgi:hypothetical protein